MSGIVLCFDAMGGIVIEAFSKQPIEACFGCAP
jgi:hypothetical protein